MAGLWQDVRFALRSLAKNPSFALLATLTLSIGIGSTTSIFSVVNAVVLRPLPYPEAGQLVHIGTAMTDGRTTGGGMSPWAVNRLREQSSNLAAVAGTFRLETAIQDPEGRPVKTEAYVVTRDYFEVFGAPMTVGRAFVTEEHLRTSEAGYLVMSHRLWTNVFGADPGIVGSAVSTGSSSFTVVGVAAPDFDYPAGADLWVAFDPGDEAAAFFLNVVARLSDRSSLEQGRTELSMLALRFAEEAPGFRARTMVPTDLKEWVVGDTSQTLVILLAAAVTLLLISCANVTALLLSRGAARTREIALRAALGAGRWRLVQQLVTESLTLAAAGAVVGLVATAASMKLLVRIGPAELPRLGEVGVDGDVLLFTLAVTAATGMLFGLLPAARLVATDIKSLMGGSARGSSGGRSGAGIFNVLVFGQTGLAVLLVIAAGLLVRSFDRLSRADPGFDPESLLVLDMNFAQAAYPDYDQVLQMYEELVERLRDLPGVVSVGAAASVPLGPTTGFPLSQYVIGMDNWDEPPRATVRAVGPGHLEALGVPLLEGRTVSIDDRATGPGVAVVSALYTQQILQGAPALGQQVNLRLAVIENPANAVAYKRLSDFEVVGVVDDAKYESLALDPVPTIYLPHAQLTHRRMILTVRSAGRAATDLTGEIRDLVRSVDPSVPVDVTTMETLVTASLGTERMAMLLLLAFGVSAGALAAVGIYGVIALSVERRIPEMAIRSALGAEPSRILRLVMSRGLAVGLTGIGVGTAAAVVGRRALASQLYEISATDPVVLVGVPLLLGLVAFTAVLIPALRTRDIDLSATLRAEN